MEGRKIVREYTNNIDNVLIDFANYISPFFKRYSFITPNVITTISLVISLIGLYNIYKQNYKIGSLLMFVGYFFDCLDGHFARKYNMVTKFGDKYDHIADLSKFVLLIIVILNSKLNRKTKKLFLIFFAINTILACIHFGCQEQFYNLDSVLTYLTKLCPRKEDITWIRYFGSGNSMLMITIFVFFLKEINTKVIKSKLKFL